MEKHFSKISLRNICLTILVGLSFFGLFKYVEYRLNFFSNQIEEINTRTITIENKLNQRMALLAEAIEGTELGLTGILQQEQDKNNSFFNQFNEVANTVGALSKLSKIDPELLKKYSKVYFLNEHYVPVSLTKVDGAYKSNQDREYEVLTDIYPFLQNMIDAAKLEDRFLLVLSAYRSFDTQAVLKENYKITYGSGANRFSADQGYSEHQLGTTLDFTTQATNGKLEGFDKTGEYQWLLDNAHKYGFILSYPAGNKYYKFEPWHWRFVGISLATKLYEEKDNFYDTDQRVIDNYLGNLFDPG